MQNPDTAWCRGFVVPGTAKMLGAVRHSAASGFALQGMGPEGPQERAGRFVRDLACPCLASAEERLQRAFRGFREWPAARKKKCRAALALHGIGKKPQKRQGFMRFRPD
jgi:hypothetical protein